MGSLPTRRTMWTSTDLETRSTLTCAPLLAIARPLAHRESSTTMSLVGIESKRVRRDHTAAQL